jgi:hypothetical protein
VVQEGGERVDEDIDAFFAAYAPHPAGENAVGGEIQGATGVGATQGSWVCGEGVGDDVEAARRNAAGAELVGLGLGDRDDGVEAPKGEPLEHFVSAILPSATGETVYGGYYRQIRLMARVAAHDV